MTFDATKEAAKIENMAKQTIDGADSSATNNLAKEWLSLTPQQRNDVGQALKDQYDNHSWNSLPIPKLEYDAKGDCTAIDFSASKLDFGAKEDSIRLAVIKPSTGGQIAEVAAHESGEKGFQWLKGIAFDSDETLAKTKVSEVVAAGGVAYDLPGMPGSKLPAPDAGNMPSASMDSPQAASQKKPPKTAW